MNITKKPSEVLKILAFEGVFDKLFQIIQDVTDLKLSFILSVLFLTPRFDFCQGEDAVHVGPFTIYSPVSAVHFHLIDDD